MHTCTTHFARHSSSRTRKCNTQHFTGTASGGGATSPVKGSAKKKGKAEGEDANGEGQTSSSRAAESQQQQLREGGESSSHLGGETRTQEGVSNKEGEQGGGEWEGQGSDLGEGLDDLGGEKEESDNGGGDNADLDDDDDGLDDLENDPELAEYLQVCETQLNTHRHMLAPHAHMHTH